jgi:hypothetical protein
MGGSQLKIALAERDFTVHYQSRSTATMQAEPQVSAGFFFPDERHALKEAVSENRRHSPLSAAGH